MPKFALFRGYKSKNGFHSGTKTWLFVNNIVLTIYSDRGMLAYLTGPLSTRIYQSDSMSQYCYYRLITLFTIRAAINLGLLTGELCHD